METKHNDELDPVDKATNDDGEPTLVDPEEAEEGGFAGGGGPAAAIYEDEDDVADEHGDRLSRAPDESR